MKPIANWYRLAHAALLGKMRVDRKTLQPEGLEWLSNNSRLPAPRLQLWVPGTYRHKRAKIVIADLAEALDGFRILHLADLHFTARWGKAHDQLIATVAQDPPDLILFTGDFVEDRCDHRAGMENVLKLFSRLQPRLGTYAILGNHDPDVMTPYLLEAGIRLITESQIRVATPDGPIELIGFPGQARLDLDPVFLGNLRPKEKNIPRIILSHYPDLIGAALPLQPDLYLCGHTHGGQICLPGENPILTHDTLPRLFARGLHRIDNTWINISNGIGFTGISIRAFCPSEVIEFVLTK